MLEQRMWKCEKCIDGRCVTVVEDDVGEIEFTIDPGHCPFKTAEEVAVTGGQIAEWHEVEPVAYAKWGEEINEDNPLDLYGEDIPTEITHGMVMKEGLARIKNACELIIGNSVDHVDMENVEKGCCAMARALRKTDTDLVEDILASMMTLRHLIGILENDMRECDEDV